MWTYRLEIPTDRIHRDLDVGVYLEEIHFTF